MRVARGDRCVVRKGNEKADLAQAWSEMTERQVRDPASHRESRSSFFYDVVPAQDKKRKSMSHHAGRTSRARRPDCVFPSPHPCGLLCKAGIARAASVPGRHLRAAPFFAATCAGGGAVASRRRSSRRVHDDAGGRDPPPRRPWGPSPYPTHQRSIAFDDRRSTCSKREPAGLGGRSPNALASDLAAAVSANAGSMRIASSR